MAFEALGRSETILQALRAVRDGGRVVVVEIVPGGVAVPVEITRLVRRGTRLMGSYGGRVRTDIPRLVRMVQQDLIDPVRTISRRVSLEDAPPAYNALNRGQIVGRAIVVMP